MDLNQLTHGGNTIHKPDTFSYAYFTYHEAGQTDMAYPHRLFVDSTDRETQWECKRHPSLRYPDRVSSEPPFSPH